MRAPLPDLDALDIEALKALILSQDEEKQRQLDELDRQRVALDQQRTQYQAELLERAEQIEHLRLVVEKLRRMLFGRKSEKLSIQLDQLELQLEEMEAIHAALASAPVRDAQSDNTGAKPTRKRLPEYLQRQIVTHEPKQQCCPECGGDLRRFGEDLSEQLDYIPESFRVIRHVRPKFACSKCETVIEAPARSRPIARGLAAPPGCFARELPRQTISTEAALKYVLERRATYEGPDREEYVAELDRHAHEHAPPC